MTIIIILKLKLELLNYNSYKNAEKRVRVRAGGCTQVSSVAAGNISPRLQNSRDRGGEEGA